MRVYLRESVRRRMTMNQVSVVGCLPMADTEGSKGWALVISCRLY